MLEVGIIFSDAWEWKGLIDVLEMLWRAHTFTCPLSVSAPLKVRETVQMAFCTKSATFSKCGQMHTYGIKLAWLPPHNTSFISFILTLSALFFQSVSIGHAHTFVHWPSHPHRKWHMCGMCAWNKKNSWAIRTVFSNQHLSPPDGSFLNTLGLLSLTSAIHLCHWANCNWYKLGD